MRAPDQLKIEEVAFSKLLETGQNHEPQHQIGGAKSMKSLSTRRSTASQAKNDENKQIVHCPCLSTQNSVLVLSRYGHVSSA